MSLLSLDAELFEDRDWVSLSFQSLMLGSGPNLEEVLHSSHEVID
jgi:hypothetical protein